jgi:hypothetical protein
MEALFMIERKIHIAWVVGCLIYPASLAMAADPSHGSPEAMPGKSADKSLDSRTLAHPEWTQVSGEVEEVQTVSKHDKPGRLVVKLKAIEGGPIIADLGEAAQLNNLELQQRDYIHVRGHMTKQGNNQVLLARELIADGKVICIPGKTFKDQSAQDAEVFGDNEAGIDGAVTPKTQAAGPPKAKETLPKGAVK